MLNSVQKKGSIKECKYWKTKENYLEFLSSGGCNYPLEILKKVDVDMTTSKPIEEALSMFEDKLNKVKKLIK